MNNIMDATEDDLFIKIHTLHYLLREVQRAVLDAASLRNDEVHKLLPPLREEIINLQ